MSKDTGSSRDSTASSAAKKRRKEEPSGASLLKSSSNSKPTDDNNVYKLVIDYEEAEALKRDPEEDLKLVKKTCEEFRTLLGEIAEIKAKNKDPAAIAEKKTQASLLFVLLKKLNRLEKFRMKNSRDLLHKVKQQVDSQHLHLQNLLYEVLHLKKEVTKCLQFKSKDEEIDLVTVEEFYKEAPETISRPDQTKTDSHQLKLARLEWELKQRKQLATQCQELQAGKETVAAEIQKKKTHLESLAPMLKDILSATKPVQEYLGFTGSTRVVKQPETAYLLPNPLYFLYVQASSYQEASANKNMAVTISGDEEEAQRMRRTAVSNKQQYDHRDDSDSDNQEEKEGGKRHHRKKSKTDRQEERKKHLLVKHPLSVIVSITLNSGSSLQLAFFYLINLNIITVKVKVVLVEVDHSISASHLISGETILSELFPNDFGLESPNVANHYQLKQVGLNSYDSKEYGLAYYWAQKICGFDFASAQNECKVEPTSTVSQENLPGILKAIKKRLAARISLYKQIQSLESRTVPVQPELSSEFASKTHGSIEFWQTIVHADYISLPYTAHLLTAASVSESDSFFKTVISRGSSVKLHAAVVLKSDFPSTTPVFALQIETQGKQLNAKNDEAIRDMEREVNHYCKEYCSTANLKEWILTAQMLQLLSCFDIYLEAVMTSQFPREKIFIQPVRGKTRSLPYKYMKTGNGIFIQH
ncbi:THO complex subunit 5 homolog A [Nilaparvata lugens]|uniref:THO complex subunit 5 homolog A n=1 Tax=Nilaparvata lugens TaxID=108931 RepID=UPI00193DD007|nr:THO complex subunit 5 homolog A [Nilaparvata lugens]XP_039292055.1 THO complex subunit 5 homolog A [Nilaparvata lugens]